jgi:VRR-NUC domain
MIMKGPRREQAAKNALEKRGWTVLKGGWPDFICTRVVNGKIEMCMVEVKAEDSELSDRQVQMHRILRDLGIPVHILTVYVDSYGAWERSLERCRVERKSLNMVGKSK